MRAQTLGGAEVAQAIDEQTAKSVAQLATQGCNATLAVVRVGERPDDMSYERGVMKRSAKLGIAVRQELLPEDVSQERLCARIDELNADAQVHGILMFCPLPAHLDERAVRERVASEKDVDALTQASLASVFTGNGSGFAPCTAQSCIEICDHYGISLAGKKVVVVGRSLVVGKPVAMLALSRDATATIAHSKTRDLPALTREADVVISCVGRAKTLGAECFASGQVVIDVGINYADGALCGDVDTEAAAQKVVAITPVPGGVGSVTTSVLCKHVAEAAHRSCEGCAPAAAS